MVLREGCLLEDTALSEEILFYEQFYGYVSRKEPLFKHDVIRTSDITGERLWLLDEGHCFRDQLVRFCQMEAVKLHQMAYHLGSMETFMRMVEGGKGITFVPELAVSQLSNEQKELVRPFAIPRPTLQQRIEMIWYAIHTCHSFGIEQPRISLIHCTEKVSAKFPHSLDYVNIVELAEAGEFGNVIIDGPLDVRTSCEQASGNIKGIVSPINGQADVLIFPNIESGNTFYKSVSLFANADMAGLLQGPVCPVVLPSRSDSGLSKYYSMAMACLTCK